MYRTGSRTEDVVDQEYILLDRNIPIKILIFSKVCIILKISPLRSEKIMLDRRRFLIL